MIELSDVDTAGLLHEAESGFTLGSGSAHGPVRWRAVLSNGMVFAEQLQGDRSFVAVFALLHDCRREDEWVKNYTD